MGGCNNTSSNCVIWQGPDIECLGLCHGATVTQVVYELATLYCNFIKSLDIENFNLNCLPTQCPPETFKDLVQLIIDTLCQIQVTNGENGTNGNYTQVEAFAPGENGCVEGGVAIRTFDGATNTQLSEYFICNAVDGNDGLPGVKGDRGDYVQVSAAAIGQCPTGGYVITLLDGTDDSVISTSIICNGANGVDGNDGADGINGVDGNDGANGDYIETLAEPVGVNCSGGGIRVNVRSGIDNSIISTEYVCNGDPTPLVWQDLEPYLGTGWLKITSYLEYAVDVQNKLVYLRGEIANFGTADVNTILFTLTGMPGTGSVGKIYIPELSSYEIIRIDQNTGLPNTLELVVDTSNKTIATSANISLDNLPVIRLK